MSNQSISQEKILRFAVVCIVVSSVAVMAFIPFRHGTYIIRGPAGGVGIMSALIGGTVAGWFAIRTRDRKLTTAALLSLLPLAFWAWVIYDAVYANAA